MRYAHDALDLEHMHTAEATAARLTQAPKQSGLRDWVLGGIDGAITTFAIVASVAGAAFFAIGSLKARWSKARWWMSGFETIGIGLFATTAAYFIGDLLKIVLAR